MLYVCVILHFIVHLIDKLRKYWYFTMSDKQMILRTFNACYYLIRLAECLIRLRYDTLIENAKVDIN